MAADASLDREERECEAVSRERCTLLLDAGYERSYFPPISKLNTLPVPIKELLAGGIAGAMGKTSVAPLERCKILFQTGKLHGGGVTAALRGIYASEGVLGLFRGNGASVLRIVPYASFHFGAYEYYRRILVDAGVAGASHASVPPVVDLLAGSTAGATAVLITYPLDLVRTRLAFHTEGGTMAAITRVPCGNVIRASSAAAAGAVGGGAAMHAAGSGSLGVAAGGLASAAASSAAAIAASGSSSSGSAALSRPARLSIRGVLASTWQREGLRGMYHGVGASFYGILPYAGLKFYVYQHLKKWYWASGGTSRGGGQPNATGGSSSSSSSSEGSSSGGTSHRLASAPATQQQRLPVPVMLACGGVAGLVAQSATYPFDVVRRRMQVEGLSEHLSLGSGNGGAGAQHRFSLRSTPQALLLLAQREGWRTLFSGLSINYMKVVPSTAIGFTIYDWLKGWLGLPQNL